MQNVQSKVVLITGASSGIGEATARLLAKNGAKVVLGARRTDRLESIVQDIRQAGGQAVNKIFKELRLTQIIFNHFKCLLSQPLDRRRIVVFSQCC